MRLKQFAILTAALVAAGCSQPDANAPTESASVLEATSDVTIDQANLCEVKAWRREDVADKCKPGQKVVFLPNNWGNEQLPILFAAVNCDLRYSVALTPGAVTCIYGPITLRPDVPETEAPEPAR